MSEALDRGEFRGDEAAALAAARAGDERAFEALIQPHVAPLRSYLYRMICDAADADDLTQDTLLKAHQKLGTFRERSSFRTWLFAIGTRNCLDLLRRRNRWPNDAQERGEQIALGSPAVMRAIDDVIGDPDFVYDYRQHLAYCFSCVARSLPPEQSAALMLTEIFLFEARAAAKITDLSESTFRHRLASARATMKQRFEGLCALIGKRGVCYQCAALRDYCPGDRRGIEPEPLAPGDGDGAGAEHAFRRRLAVVRDTDLAMDRLHEVLFRFMSDLWNGQQPAR